MEVEKKTDVIPILKNRKRKDEVGVVHTFFHTDNVVRLSSRDFTLDSDLKLGLEYNNLFAILFYQEGEFTEIFKLWEELSSEGGIIMASINIEFEFDVRNTIEKLSLFHPFHWFKTLVYPAIIVYNEGFPQGFYEGDVDKESIREFLNKIKQRNFKFKNVNIMDYIENLQEEEWEMVEKIKILEKPEKKEEQVKEEEKKVEEKEEQVKEEEKKVEEKEEQEEKKVEEKEENPYLSSFNLDDY